MGEGPRVLLAGIGWFHSASGPERWVGRLGLLAEGGITVLALPSGVGSEAFPRVVKLLHQRAQAGDRTLDPSHRVGVGVRTVLSQG